MNCELQEQLDKARIPHEICGFACWQYDTDHDLICSYCTKVEALTSEIERLKNVLEKIRLLAYGYAK